MVGRLLLRGMLAGLLAGFLAFGFARFFGEPQVDRAIAFEEELSKSKGEAPEPELVSRETQAGFGLLTGVLVYSAALGGLFSLVFAFAYGRFGRMGARPLSALLAAGGFIAIVIVPFVKYPANPPSIGNPETIGIRTALYFGMILISVLSMGFAQFFGSRISARIDAWTGVVGGGAVFLVIVTVCACVLPEVNEVPEAFSAVLLWRFRVAALGIQLVLWTTLALLFGLLAERCLSARLARLARD